MAEMVAVVHKNSEQQFITEERYQYAPAMIHHAQFVRDCKNKQKVPDRGIVYRTHIFGRYVTEVLCKSPGERKSLWDAFVELKECSMENIEAATHAFESELTQLDLESFFEDEEP